MPRIELYSRIDCAEARIITDWLHSAGHSHLWRDMARPDVASDLRYRTRLAIAPVTLVDGRPIWGHGAEQVCRLQRLLGRRRWTLPW